MLTTTTRPSAGSLSRRASPSFSNRVISWVIAGWVTPSGMYSSLSRCGPDRSSRRSVEAAVRLSSSRGVSRRYAS
jgi:hypothetical protein